MPRTSSVDRRTVLKACSASLLLSVSPGGRAASNAEFAARLRALEAESGGRLGVGVLRGGERLDYRGAERFGLCSTFKLPLVALVLRDAALGKLSLDRVVAYSEDDMVPYAPVTSQHLQRGGMTVFELAKAAQITSDNVAANLLLRELGGPRGFTNRLRELGDGETRLDRYEPELNLVPPGETRDTTTPCAIAETVMGFVTGDTLTREHRDLLRTWMEATRTGAQRLRAGLPDAWPAGDKTGTGIGSGMANKYNDVAVAWPPGEEPIVIAAYFEADGEYDEIRTQDEAVLAAVGAAAVTWIGSGA